MDREDGPADSSARRRTQEVRDRVERLYPDDDPTNPQTRHGQLAYDAQQRARQEERERKDRLYAGDWLGGRLLAHGKAPYHNDPNNMESYYVKLTTQHGRLTLWGKDLARAIKESKSHVKVGDAVGVRITLRESFGPDKSFNHWQVDKAIDIVKERRIAREILEHPISARRARRDGTTVTGSYLLVTAAEMLAEARYTDEASRKRFVEKVREAAGMSPTPLGQPHAQESSPQKSPRQANAPGQLVRQGFARE